VAARPHTEGKAIAALLAEVVAMVIPRTRGRYNDPAVPATLFDHLALGRPMLLTNRTEQVAAVACADARMVVGDSEAVIADGVRRMSEAVRTQLDRWAANAGWTGSYSWRARADTILETIGINA
jgi:hypothetical protein